MKILWHGLGSFSISGKPISGEVSIVTDPYTNDVGLRYPRTLTAAAVVQSHEGDYAGNSDAIEGMRTGEKPFLITHAGEFEVQGVFVRGIQAPKKDKTEHTIYRITVAGIRIAHLGAIDRELTDKEVELLGDIDVLIVPVGGVTVLDADQAQKVVNQVEPRVVIPSYHAVDGLKESFSNAEAFCKALACPREDVNKITLKKSKLPMDDLLVYVPARV